MVTTGQLLIIPSENTMFYKPVWCTLKFDFQKLDSPTTKTFFEVVSSRKLLKTEGLIDRVLSTESLRETLMSLTLN